MLFLQGARDRMAPEPLITGVVARLRWATLRIVPDADHGFRVPKRTGLGEGDVLDLLAGAMVAWASGDG